MRIAAKLLSIACRTAVLAATCFALHRLCWIPYRCNQTAKRAHALTLRALDASPVDAPAFALANLATIKGSLEHCPSDVRLLMIAAANERILLRPERAVSAYQRALQVDERPEIYLELGLTQLSMGNRTEAVANLTRAGRFATQYIYEPEDPAIVDEIRRNLGLPQLPR
jgi:hypothetical protein